MNNTDIFIYFIAFIGVFIIPILLCLLSIKLPPKTIDPPQITSKPIKIQKSKNTQYFKKIFNMARIKNLSQIQKTFIIFSLISVILLILVLCDIYGFSYVFLRIVISISMIGFLLEKFPFWYKIILGLNLILYNPIAIINMDSKRDWIPFNWITLLLIIISLIIFAVKLFKTEPPANS